MPSVRPLGRSLSLGLPVGLALATASQPESGSLAPKATPERGSRSAASSSSATSGSQTERLPGELPRCISVRRRCVRRVRACAVHELYLRGCVSRGSLPGGVRHAVTRALLRVLPQERAPRAYPPSRRPVLYGFGVAGAAPRVPTLGREREKRVARSSVRGTPGEIGAGSEVRREGIALRLVYVCLRVHAGEIRSDTRGDDSESSRRARGGCPVEVQRMFPPLITGPSSNKGFRAEEEMRWRLAGGH